MLAKMAEHFLKCIEDFVCNNCGESVKGDGYTNHCPKCLYSKHVDINPGDRKAICNGVMEPIHVEYKRNGYIITHRCKKCGHTKRNRASEKDSMDKIIFFELRNPLLKKNDYETKTCPRRGV